MHLSPVGRSWLCVLRSLILAGVSVSAGTVLHVAAGGERPGTHLLVAVWLVAAPGVAALVGRRPTERRVLAAVLGSQTLLHVVLAVSCTVAGLCEGAHGHHPGAHPATGATHAAGHASELLMVGAHLAASALVCWWLARGEHALWVLLLLSVRPLRTAIARCSGGWDLATAPARRTSARPTSRTGAAVGVSRVLEARVVTRRGPPALSV